MRYRKSIILFGLLAICAVFFFGVHSTQASALQKLPNNLGLVGYWSFEDGAGTKVTDFSGKGNEGTLSGTATWVNGKRGKAVSFTGTSSFVVNNTVANFGSSNFTQRFLVKFASSSQPFVYTGNGAYQVSGWYLEMGYGVTYGIFNNFGGNDGFSYDFTPVANRWYDFAMVRSGASSYLYIDGVLVDGGGAFSADTSSANYTISHNANTDWTIDEVRLYSRALDAAEILALYNSGATKVSASQNTRGPQSGLIGEWSFDGADATGTLALDRSGNGNNATLTNGATFARGKFGQAIQFASASGQYAITGNAAVLRPTTAVTLSTWIKTTTDGKDVAGSGIHGYGLQIGAGQTYWYTYGNTNGYMHLATPTLTNGNWHHLVGTWDGAGPTSKIYVDGVDINATLGGTLPTTLDYSQSAFYIGDDPGGGGGTFNGLIDEVRVYNRALSAAEVLQLYSLGGVTVNKSSAAGSAASGLVLWHTFDGPKLNSTTSTDSSSSGINGTLTNGPVPVRGKLGQALSFDGSNDYVDLGSSLNLTNYGTVSFWAKPNSTWPDYAVMLDKSQISGDSAQYRIQRNGSTNQLTFYDTNDTLSGGTITTGAWNHIVVTFNAGTAIGYINGAQVFTGACQNPLNNPTGSVLIGRYSGAGALFDGSMDDVRIYNRALSAAEVLQLYNQGK